METKISALTYARHLRKRLKELKEARAKEVKRHHAAFAAWKKNLHAWIKANTEERVNKIGLNDLETSYGSERRYMKHFFFDAPEPPKRKTFPEIREIEGLLRHLAITGRQYVTVSTNDVKRYMTPKDEDNDE